MGLWFSCRQENLIFRIPIFNFLTALLSTLASREKGTSSRAGLVPISAKITAVQFGPGGADCE